MNLELAYGRVNPRAMSLLIPNEDALRVFCTMRLFFRKAGRPRIASIFARKTALPWPLAVYQARTKRLKSRCCGRYQASRGAGMFLKKV